MSVVPYHEPSCDISAKPPKRKHSYPSRIYIGPECATAVIAHRPESSDRRHESATPAEKKIFEHLLFTEDFYFPGTGHATR